MSWKYFTEEEMACTHCGECEMDDDFMAMLDQLREIYGKPLKITSGYRCPEHNIEKVKKNGPGAHATGAAVDLGLHGDEAYKIVKLAQEIGFTGIGIAQKGHIGSRFIHVDNLGDDERSPRPWIWSY
jgi:zinc D-Ala-D-Ala carboxypeptidase